MVITFYRLNQQASRPDRNTYIDYRRIIGKRLAAAGNSPPQQTAGNYLSWQTARNHLLRQIFVNYLLLQNTGNHPPQQTVGKSHWQTASKSHWPTASKALEHGNGQPATKQDKSGMIALYVFLPKYFTKIVFLSQQKSFMVLFFTGGGKFIPNQIFQKRLYLYTFPQLYD